MCAGVDPQQPPTMAHSHGEEFLETPRHLLRRFLVEDLHVLEHGEPRVRLRHDGEARGGTIASRDIDGEPDRAGWWLIRMVSSGSGIPLYLSITVPSKARFCEGGSPAPGD